MSKFAPGLTGSQREPVVSSRDLPRLSSRLTLIAAAVAAALAAAQTARAAEAQDEEIQEVLVTARQREERLTDVPVTVQAFTATEIRAAGIERPQDFIALTPGVAQVQTAEVGDLQVNIRGINTGRDAETNFALVIDGVLQTNPNALNQELAGVQQIEVLKGPQGALYGRNALAGAMIITTRAPGEEFQADVTAGFGSDDLRKADLWLGGPVGGNLRVGVSAFLRETDGQWDNAFLGCDDCADYHEERGGQLRALFDVGGGTLDFKARYSTIDAGAINFNASLALSDASIGLGAPIFKEDPNRHDFVYLNNIKPINEQENLNFSLKGEWQLGRNTLTAYAARNDQENFFLTDGTSAAFFLYSLTPSCIQSDAARSADTPLPAPFFYANPTGAFVESFLPPYSQTTCDGYQYQQRDQEDTSFEIRLASPGDQHLRWIGGLYYGDIERRVVVSQGADQSGALAGPAPNLLAQAFVPVTGPNPTDLLYDDTFDSTVAAVFGQVAYDVVPNVEVALALRYDREKREVNNNVPTCTAQNLASGPCRAQTPGFAFGSTPFINPSYTANPAFATSGIPNRERTFTQVQPKLSLNWKLTEDFSTYASYGYGFRSGGFNSTGSADTIIQNYGVLCYEPGSPLFSVPACGPGAVPNLDGVRDDYDKEVSRAAELGFKAQLANRRLAVNGSLFHTRVEDMQFFNFFAGPFGLLRVVTNIDEVTIQGVELDARWRANRFVTLFAGASYLDTEIDEFRIRPYTRGNKVPYAPEFTANGGVDLTVPFGETLALVARLDVSAVGETWFHPVQENRIPNLFTLFGFGQGEFSNMKRDSYAIGNLRIGLQGGNWGVTAWSRNITDENYLAEIIPAPEFGGSFIHDAPGRSYGLDVNYRF